MACILERVNALKNGRCTVVLHHVSESRFFFDLFSFPAPCQSDASSGIDGVNSLLFHTNLKASLSHLNLRTACMLGEAEVGPCRQLFLEPWRRTQERLKQWNQKNGFLMFLLC